MTILVSKPALNIREELSSLKRPTGAFGDQLLRTNTAQDFYTVVGNNRNLLINGDFRIAQRGTTFSPATSGAYCLDRWQGYYGTGQVVGATVSQSTDVPSTESFKNSFKITLASPSNTGTAIGYPFLRQIIEDFTTIVGTTSKKDLTVSFWAKSSVNMTMTVDVGDNEANGLTAQLTTSWKYYTWTYPRGSAFTFTAVDFQNASSAGDIYITGVQLEFGKVATPFEYRPYGLELSLCQRYYERFTGGSSNTFRIGYGYNTNIYMHLPWQTPKRISGGTVSYSSTDANTVYVAYGNAVSSGSIQGVTTGGMTTSVADAVGVTFYATTTASTYSPYGTAILWAVRNGQWIDYSAEL